MKDFLIIGGALLLLYLLSKSGNGGVVSNPVIVEGSASPPNGSGGTLPVVGMSLLSNFISGLNSLFSGVTTPNTNTSSLTSNLGNNSLFMPDASLNNTSSADSTGYDGSSPLTGLNFLNPAPTLQTLPDPSTGDNLSYLASPVSPVALDPVTSDTNMLDLSPGGYAAGDYNTYDNANVGPISPGGGITLPDPNSY
jgi:hypothetical protein